jgi:dipeptidyl aminopeptidase/acylaminoacyl peptidase
LPSEVVNTLVVVNMTTQAVAVLVSGVDFYSSPRFSPDGTKLAWIEWTHPDMPFEGSQLYVANVVFQGGTYALADAKFIAGKPNTVSVVQALWASDDTLVFLSDEVVGYYNPWVYHPSASSAPLPILKSPLQEDFAEMMWFLGMYRWTILDADTVLATSTSTRNGTMKLLLIAISTGETKELENPYPTIWSTVHALSPTSAVFSANKFDDAPELVKLTLSGDRQDKAEYTVLKKTSDLARTLPAGVLSRAEPYTLDGGNIHVFLSLPKNDGYRGPEGEKPPVVVNIHGGPQSRAFPGLSWFTQYFTSRGWAWYVTHALSCRCSG